MIALGISLLCFDLQEIRSVGIFAPGIAEQMVPDKRMMEKFGDNCIPI